MINQYQVNEWVVADSEPPVLITQDDIVFDGFSLQNWTTVSCSFTDFDNQGGREISSFDFPNNDGGGLISSYQRGRIISFDISLKEETKESFNTLLDTFKKSLRKTEWNLDIRVNGEIRRIKATCKPIKFDRKNYNNTFVKAKVSFITDEPFFYKISPQSWLIESQTKSFYSEIDNAGFADAFPIFYIVFRSWSTVSNILIEAFSKSFSISESFVSNDIVIIDMKTETVTKNGVEIDYSGQFIKFTPWSCPFHIVFTGSVLADFSLILDKNYT